MTSTHDNRGETTVFRNDKSFWGLAFIFTIVAFAIPVATLFSSVTMTSPLDRWFVAGWCALFGSIAIGCAWFAVRCQVVVDSTGLAFFDFFGQRYYRWADIEDYELRLAAANLWDQWATSKRVGVGDEYGVATMCLTTRCSNASSMRRNGAKLRRGSAMIYARTGNGPRPLSIRTSRGGSWREYLC
jgi:hypothetical protein